MTILWSVTCSKLSLRVIFIVAYLNLYLWIISPWLSSLLCRMYLVDDRMFQWLKQCCRVSRVSETNIALMDFAQIFYDMQANRFMCFLPPSIKKLTKDQVDDTGKKE